jgi:hypothetical protein
MRIKILHDSWNHQWGGTSQTRLSTVHVRSPTIKSLLPLMVSLWISPHDTPPRGKILKGPLTMSIHSVSCGRLDLSPAPYWFTLIQWFTATFSHTRSPLTNSPLRCVGTYLLRLLGSFTNTLNWICNTILNNHCSRLVFKQNNKTSIII